MSPEKHTTIGITIGDPSGIGPEVIAKALTNRRWHEVEFKIFGDRQLFERTSACPPVERGTVEFLHVGNNLDLNQIEFGQSCIEAATIQFRAFERAIDAAKHSEIDAIVTAPWTKHQLRLIGEMPQGHTDILTDAFPKDTPVMMLAGPKIRVALCTTHIPLKEVSSKLTAQKIETTVETTATELIDKFGIETPMVAVCGLNPHAGEGGIMGSEEIDYIEETVTKINRDNNHFDIIGPKPSDTLFAQTNDDEFPYDAVVCMYHDQGLIPLKMAHFGNSANITLGLPIVRTSVDHGSAYDIAGKGVADPGSMIYAIEMAEKLVKSQGKPISQ